MQVTVEQPEPCTVVLDINVDENEVARAFDNVYREFGRFARVPGFRPGKAPRAILQRYVDADRVRERAMEKLIGDTFVKAINEHGYQPFRQPRVTPTDLEDRKPYTYKATIALEPQVTLGEYTGLTIERPVFPLTDAMIDLRIDQIRKDRARLERVTDRGVEAGDVLIAENQVALEGEEAPAPRRQLVQVGNNIPGFDDAITGMMPGEERTFELTYPEDYDEEERRGKKATFTIKLHSISARKLPEVDAEFAQAVAGVDSVEALRETLRERLQAELAEASDRISEQRLLVEVMNRSTILFPRLIVEEEMEDRLKELQSELKQNNLSYDEYLQSNNLTQEAHQTQVATEAEMRVRTLLVLRQIAAQENLMATDEAIDAEFDRLLSEGRISEEVFERYVEDRRRRMQLGNALVQKQLHDFLFANNTFTDVVQAEPPTGDEE